MLENGLALNTTLFSCILCDLVIPSIGGEVMTGQEGIRLIDFNHNIIET